MPINYYSTNRNTPEVDFFKAILTGQAPDRGLYLPDFIPSVDKALLEKMKGMEYYEVAYTILRLYLDDITDEELMTMCKDAYGFYPRMEKVDSKNHIMWLDQGPTASFKDFAAQIMARLMGHKLGKDEELLILTATSGDTGSAIAHAFHNIPNINVVILFPYDEVSDNQRKQMTTLGGNVKTLAIDGKFDHGQAMVKDAFADPRIKDMNLTSANSINIARLLPQSVYYFWAYLNCVEKIGDEVMFSVPSGNFGDMLGAVLAKKMGLPIKKLAISTNANDEVPLFFETGKYTKIEPSKKCISNAMNVGHPSNFARLIDLFGGRMDENGVISQSPDMEKMRQLFFATSIDDETTRETIKETWNKHKIILEPHGAVGWKGLERMRESFPENDNIVSISLETANPAKFPDEIVKIIGVSPQVPETLKGLEDLTEYYESIHASYDDFYNWLIK
jgi:threonine synthase